MKLAAALLFFSTLAFAQAPEVPAKMQFAGMTLTIRDDARREIQKDVNMLTQSARHHTIKVERAKTYFPIIEKIFAEERVPDDFKYLVLQESALIADAVSVSNAVGFWQFKDFTAVEMGLRVDKEIDERMNIASSTRAAARYIKKNNYYFNNWIYALQAYQMGAGGTMKAVKDYQSGTKHMEINSQTYWYVKKYLAHKVAFEGTTNGTGEVKVFMVTNRTRRSLEDVAKEFYIDEEQLKTYNKWVRKTHIPDDKPYVLAIPSANNNQKLNEAVAKAEAKTAADQPARITPRTADVAKVTMMLHGIPAIKAVAGETPATLAQRAGVTLSVFLKHNDISVSDRITEGEFYYLKRKKTKGPVSNHVVKAGDNLWSISQQYGVQLRKLERYNKLKRNSTLQAGAVVYLSNKRTAAEVEFTGDPVEVETGDAFSWTVQPEAVPVTDVQPLQPVELKPQADTAKTETAFVQHTVTAGETLYSIAKRYQVGVMELAAWNNLSLAEGIRPGQVLKLIPGAAQVTETSPAIPVPQPQPIEEIQSPADSVKTETLVVQQHIVEAGESLYAIARRYQLAVNDLAEWNNLSLAQSLKPGQVLSLIPKTPAATAEPQPKSEEIIHTVKTSDTLYSIAREYGVSIKELMDWNQKKDFNLTIGEKLRIVKKQ